MLIIIAMAVLVYMNVIFSCHIDVLHTYSNKRDLFLDLDKNSVLALHDIDPDLSGYFLAFIM